MYCYCAGTRKECDTVVQTMKFQYLRSPKLKSNAPVSLCLSLAFCHQVVDQFLVASEFKIKYAWLGEYYFIVYIFFNVGYYYETTGEDRLTYEVFDWEGDPGKAILWIFLIMAFFIPGFAGFHFFVYRYAEVYMLFGVFTGGIVIINRAIICL